VVNKSSSEAALQQLEIKPITSTCIGINPEISLPLKRAIPTKPTA
jgi:hypothetical protein